jgi:putative ABC transport system permease protein
MLLKRPGFTAVAVTVLALGIGATSAIFSAANAVMLLPLPYDKPEQLVWIWSNNTASDIKQEPASLPDFVDWREQNRSFEDIAAFATWLPILTGEGDPERMPCGTVSANFFPLLGVEPSIGRGFSAEEDQPANKRVVMLSHNLWRRRFGMDRDIAGKSIQLNGIPHTVVGVMPESFQYPAPDDRKATELWVPLGYNPNNMPRRMDFLNVIGRLKPGLSMGQTQVDLATIAAGLEKQYPETNAGWSITLVPLHERFVGDMRPALLLLIIAVSFLLLVACANVANLLLVRSAARQKEIAIRAALGATRHRLVQQFLTESLLLAVIGGAFGLLLAWVGIRALIAFSPNNIPRIEKATLDLRVLGFTLLVSVLTGIIFGVVPALRASKSNLNDGLREAGRSAAEGASGRQARGLLGITEIAVVILLLIGSGLMTKSFIRLQKVEPGFDPQRLLTMELTLPRPKYKQDHLVTSFITELTERVNGLPAVTDAAIATTVPLSGQVPIMDFIIEGQPPLPSGQVNDAQWQVVSPSYFHTLGIPLLRGRVFDDRDTQDAARVVVVNDAMAKRYWQDEDPLGGRLQIKDSGSEDWLTVAGVVGDVRQVGLDLKPYPQMYEVYAQNPVRDMAFIVRSDAEPTDIVPAVRNHVVALDKDLALYNVRSMEEVLADSISRPRFNTQLMNVLTAVAVVLMIVGVYGVISYSVSQRTQEIGIRMALGAGEGTILRNVIAQGLRLALVGIALGLASAFALTRFMSNLLYNVSATDGLTFIVVPAVVTLVVLAACYVPARKAAKVDPMVALRFE